MKDSIYSLFVLVTRVQTHPELQNRGSRAQHCRETSFLSEAQKEHVELLACQLASAGVFCEGDIRCCKIERDNQRRKPSYV
jgi:hypothetical protein